MDTSAAEAILDRLPLVSVPQARMMRALWESGNAPLRQRAWHRGRRILELQGGLRAYEQASDAVGRWIRDHATGRIGQVYEVYESISDQMRLDTRIAAAPPILDAILASLLPTELAEDERDELLAPWTIALEPDEPDGPDEPDEPAQEAA